MDRICHAIAEAFRDLAEYRKAKWRKGEIDAPEMLFIASPGFFGPVPQIAQEWPSHEFGRRHRGD